jgi:signal transduction histidine kinase
MAVVLVVAAQLELHLVAPGGASLATALLAVGVTLPLAWRRSAPLGALGVVLGSYLVHLVVVGPPVLSVTLAVAFLLSVYSSGAYQPARPALVALGLALTTGIVLSLRSPDPGIDALLASNLFSVVVPWLVGTLRARQRHARALRDHASRLERERDEQARRAVSLERARIARELHDIVAHAASVIVVQAEAGEALLGTGRLDEASVAFRSIQHNGRQALDELRRLLGLLRSDEEEALAPQPRIADVSTLVEHFNAAGVTAALQVEGEARLVPRGIELSVYRFVQEALTNVLKHAGPASATVLVRYGDETLDVEVVDDGIGAHGPMNGGYGLVGMRERVRIYGGTFEAGPSPNGGFALRARLPIVQR